MRSIVLTALVLGLAAATASAELVLRTLDGRRVVASTVRMEGDALIVEAAGGEQRIGFDTLVAAEAPTAEVDEAARGVELVAQM